MSKLKTASEGFSSLTLLHRMAIGRGFFILQDECKDTDTWRSCCRQLGYSAQDAYRHIALYRFTKLYPRFQLADCSWSSLTNNIKALRTLLGNDEAEAEFWRTYDGATELTTTVSSREIRRKVEIPNKEVWEEERKKPESVPPMVTEAIADEEKEKQQREEELLDVWGDGDDAEADMLLEDA
eukprot:CAMPEP_0174275932 /NCGR_PEP_ID=MMETSP0439-20130205/60109_1 /TAXON_ID=0 /ORGANISM="Stereomyxa ramosa, Strain Chinc5" /LENGTH=181 /DNA_ID=CAMNT_0015368109 /DNA_START=642 /DNA_END=1187 /DNA_ORIENTATION=+